MNIGDCSFCREWMKSKQRISEGSEKNKREQKSYDGRLWKWICRLLRRLFYVWR